MTDINTQASPELANIEFEATNRSQFLAKGVLAAGAAYGALAIGPMVTRAFAQGGGSKGDIDILNFALTLEYLEAAYYEMGLKEVKGAPKEAVALAEQFGGHEQEHVDALSATISDLGGEPVEAPGVDFGDAFASADNFLATAVVFEDLGVSAYNGAAPDIQSKELLATAGSIVQNEARHAAILRTLNGDDPFPEAFDATLTMDEVLEAATPFIKA